MNGVIVAGKHLHLPHGSRLARPDHPLPGPGLRAAVFLDRDGVIVEDVNFLTVVSDIHILPGVAHAIRMMQDRFYLIVVTNQSGLARGLLNERDLLDIHAEIVRLLAAEGAIIDAFYYCPHLPQALVMTYREECDCRKPRPGMLLRAQADWGLDLTRSFLVGDGTRDIQAGSAAGVRSILLDEAGCPSSANVISADNLRGAAGLILAHQF